MALVKKQKSKQSPKAKKTEIEEVQNGEETVISGQLQKKIKKKQQLQKDPKGVVFIKHLPHGFFEDQLKKYFEQFGNVTRVRLARSRRTGNSKGYAFVEFEYPEVAQVAAETMDNYLMFKKLVKAAYIPPEKQQFNYFRTSVKKIRNKSGKIVWVSSKTAAIQQKMKKHNEWSEENYQKRTSKQLAKLKKLNEKYAKLGIDIDKLTVQPKIKTEETEKEIQQEKTKEGKQSKALKRKSNPEQTSSSGKQQNTKKSKKKVSLEDLLGNTIQEDSEDEDYIAMPDDSDDEQQAENESSDEETYGFSKESDNEEEDEDDDDNDDEEEDEEPEFVPKKSKTKFGKSLKSSNVERFEQLLKRKPHTGGVQKLNKKPLKQPQPNIKNKGSLQIKAAKELAKPLSKVKGKLGKSLNAKKIIKKVK
ncbi:uncharacterized protein ACRADG_013262 [Cochliomyia hominivorax]